MCWQHLLPTYPLKIGTSQSIRKRPALRIGIADRSDTAHNIDETILIINFSSQIQMIRSNILTTQIIQKPLTHSSPSRTAKDRSVTTQKFVTRLTVEAVSPIGNSRSAEFDTPSVNRATTLPSSQELATADLMQMWLMSYYMMDLDNHPQNFLKI